MPVKEFFEELGGTAEARVIRRMKLDRLKGQLGLHAPQIQNLRPAE